MSIEKLSDVSKVLIEQYPFTQIPNNVIEHIKDNDAFRLYCYLISKSRDWVVVKEYAKKACGIGEKKAKACWSYFARCGLIEYRVEKDEKGRIIKHDMVVLIGLKFNKDVSFKAVDNSTGAKSAPLEKTHRGKNPPSGQSTRVDFAPLLNKDNKKERNALLNKEKEREASERKKRAPLPDDFQPDEEAKMLMKEKGLDASKVLFKFIYHAKSEGWAKFEWNAAFIKWILDEKTIKNNGNGEKNINNAAYENKCTVMEWGAGHPSFDDLQKYKRTQEHGSDRVRGAGVQKAEGYLF